MKYFSEKTGKLYDEREQLEQAEQEFDAKDKQKEAEKAAEREVLMELKDAFDKATKEYRQAMAKVDEAKCAAARFEKRVKEADDAYQKQKEKIKAREVRETSTSKRKCCVVKGESGLDPAVSALLKYLGY